MDSYQNILKWDQAMYCFINLLNNKGGSDMQF